MNTENINTMKNQPKVGDRKEVVRFAFFPMIVESRFIWFKRYKAIKEYKEWHEFDSFICHEYMVQAWQTVERKFK